MSNNYKESLKATALFGSVKIYTIFIAIIKNKFAAILLGPEGMGIAGLFTQTISTIASFTNCGIATSAVRDVSVAASTKNTEEISKIVIVLRKIVWFTGIFGLLVACILSPWLSRMVFGNDEYTVAFLLLSVTLLFDQISAGQNVVMQGLRKYNYLAKSNMSGQTIGLFISVSLYFIWGIDAIVPTLIISSIVSLLLSFFFAKKIPVKKIEVDKTTSFTKGKAMLKLGLSMSISGMITVTSAYVLRLFIANKGGVVEVGLYTSGFTIAEAYVGIVFTAMATDYYPRLSAVINNRYETKKLVSDQAMISLLLIFPILVAFVIFSPLFIKLLLSPEFLSLVFFLKTVMIGMVFRTCSWALGYVLIANRDSTLLIVSSSIFGVFMLGINILFYNFWGINGLGVSYALIYFFHFLWVSYLNYFRYRQRLSNEAIRYLIFIASGLLLCYFISICTNTILFTIILYILLLLSILFSLYQLEKRSGLVTSLKNKVSKK